MAQHYCVGFLVLISCCLLEALPRPLNIDETTIVPFELTAVEKGITNDKAERSLMYEEDNSQGNTKEIVERIKAINDAIKRPQKRPQINWNTQPSTGGGYIMDKDVLEKLQEIIASGKLHSYYDNMNHQQVGNSLAENADLRNSRQILPQMAGNPGMPLMPMPYMTSIPILVMPSINQQTGYNNDLNSIQMGKTGYMTRQGPETPTSPFGQFQWPFAQFFPILIRDPLISLINGGGWSNFIEYGQSADVCRRQKSADEEKVQKNIVDNLDDEDIVNAINEINSRQGRAIKKRTVAHETQLQDVENAKKSKKIYSTKPPTPRKPVKQAEPDTKTVNEGDLRFPFGEFTLFGNKKPVAPSPGFFINRLKVRRGGVAIAGPGGVATAGRGGTAIVGPGGLAYTQPGGLAVAGPAARVVALAPDADLGSLISRLQAQDGSVPRSLQPIIEGKVVATGPIIYYHPNQPNRSASTTYLPFYGGAKGQYLEIKKDVSGSVTSEKIVSEDKISSEIVKNSDESVLSKVLAANLRSLSTVSNNILKLQSLGRKTGHLGNTEKTRLRNQLAALGEAASNTIKLIEEIGDNVDMLFKKNVAARKKYNEDDEDDVSEEGIGIDADGSNSGENYNDDIDGGTIAEAKPIGLAVIGESGLAASRPIGTAVARKGVAIARPIATAIAGVDPVALGINFQINHSQ